LGAYGHSWAYGTGATLRDVGFAALAARALGLEHDDRAESGSLSTQTARLVASSPTPSARLLVLMTGLNDARLHGYSRDGRDAYAHAIALILDAFREASPDALVLAVEQPYISDYAGYAPFHRASDTVIDAYNATLRQVATCHLARFVPIPGWDVHTMVSLDGVHANNLGHERLAQVVVRACRQSRWFTDQKAAPSSAASAVRSAGRISR
jgi:lysophospholipase L1-like esterase